MFFYQSVTLLLFIAIVGGGCKSRDVPMEMRTFRDEGATVRVPALSGEGFREIHADDLKIISSSFTLKKVGSNLYPKIQVNATRGTEYIFYNLCRGTSCLYGSSYEMDFVVTGLNRVQYKRDDLVKVFLRPCVESVNAARYGRNCGKRLQVKVGEQAEFQINAVIEDSLLDNLLGKTEEQKKSYYFDVDEFKEMFNRTISTENLSSDQRDFYWKTLVEQNKNLFEDLSEMGDPER